MILFGGVIHEKSPKIGRKRLNKTKKNRTKLLTLCKVKTTNTIFKKLTWVMYLYDAFPLELNLGYKWKSVKGCSLKTL